MLAASGRGCAELDVYCLPEHLRCICLLDEYACLTSVRFGAKAK